MINIEILILYIVFILTQLNSANEQYIISIETSKVKLSDENITDLENIEMIKFNDLVLRSLLDKHKKKILKTLKILLKDKGITNNQMKDLSFTVSRINHKNSNQRDSIETMLSAKKVSKIEMIFFEEEGRRINMKQSDSSMLITILHKTFFTFKDKSKKDHYFPIMKRIIILKVDLKNSPLERGNDNNMVFQSLNELPVNTFQIPQREASNQYFTEENLLGAAGLPPSYEEIASGAAGLPPSYEENASGAAGLPPSYEENALGVAELPPSYDSIFISMDNLIKNLAEILDLLSKEDRTSIDLNNKEEGGAKELKKVLKMTQNDLMKDQVFFQSEISTSTVSQNIMKYFGKLINIQEYNKILIGTITNLRSKSIIGEIEIKDLFRDIEAYNKMKKDLDKTAK